MNKREPFEPGLFTVGASVSIIAAIKKLDEGGIGIITVVDEGGKVIGIITDGDFRRSVLSGINLDENVLAIANKRFRYLSKGYSKEEVTEFLNRESTIEHLLILDDGRLSNILTAKDLIVNGDICAEAAPLDNPVVIMAGGMGSRLDPFTRVLPKPLIPIGDKTIIELIMDKYMEHGISDFLVSVNYKAKMIKAYFDDKTLNYKITYLEEAESLGTAGSLKFLEKKFDKPIFVSNCDVLINDNYSNIFNFHQAGDFDLTLVTSFKSHTIPYGVCEIDNKGALVRILEKPESSFLANTGMYILAPEVLELIPADTHYHMTDLIDDLQKKGGNIGVYPILEKSWIDVGQWEQYRSAVNLLRGDLHPE